MSVTYHPDIDVVSGTDWTIAGALYDASGKLLDVTNCTLSWVLLDMDGAPVLPTDQNITISKTDAINGGILISVPRQYTVLNPGRYTDALQVIEGSNADVFWIGQLRVSANPINVYLGLEAQPPPPAPVFVNAPPWWWIPGGSYY